MIRPVTCVCFLLACGSGLYLYQEKHRAQVLDRKIEKTVRATDALRDQTRMLTAEWMLLNDPERLRQLSQQYLALKVVSPAQFTSLADLDSRLPAPKAKEPRPAEGVPIAEAAPVPEPPAAVSTEETPKLPPAATAPAQTAAKVAAASTESPRTAEQKSAHAAPPASRPEPRVADNRPEPRAAEPRRESRSAEARPERRPAEPRTPEPRHTVAAAEPARPAPTRPAPSYVSFPAPQPMPASSAPASGGSFLGMARSSLPPPMPVAPHPTPVNARQWYNN